MTADGLGGGGEDCGDRRQDPRYDRKTYRRDILYDMHIHIHHRHFRIVDDAKCIVVTRVCVSDCVSVCPRPHAPTLLHGPGCNLGEWYGMPLVVHYWPDLQSVHGLRCYGNITRTRTISEYMLVFALCLVHN